MTMQLIGILGGMSWESTALYYKLMNEHCRERLGGHSSARLVLHSVDFAEIEALQRAGDWPAMAAILGEAAKGLAAAGAAFLMIATNTMHRVADVIAAMSGLPVLHIADPTAEALQQAGVTRVGLLGTRFTMEQDFYRGRLTERHGLDVLVPEAEDRAEVHRIIYDELVFGTVREESRAIYRGVIERLAEQGAEAIIMGCTEITLLLRPQDSDLPLFDTTALHATAAVERALADG
ncbi:aspartate/glutamate racemase family protein [Mangrovibrevibacter kandeliae]|uniref:aspartate/glutamate racemase family protein n=1 Tax=Mangrovibrevibacter kandeliae TaxID=2968473 RepID=UPI0029FF0E1C|nr:aspartate/glutamate racemase family protein [Aurantimonas sp. MSK8Z-1]